MEHKPDRTQQKSVGSESLVNARLTLYLGIDLGTGTLKAAIFDDDGTTVMAAEESYDAPTSTAAGADFDPVLWWNVCRRVVRRVTASHGPEVRSVGVVGQMHGVVLVDGRGLPVRNAILWPDHRAMGVLDEIARFDDEHEGVLGNPIVPGMAGPILTWLSRTEPRTLSKASRAVQPKDWLRMQLCGADPATDPSDASATLLYDVTADDWSDAACAALGVSRDLLPQIHPSSGVAGTLHQTVAQELNLRTGVPVVTGAGDAPAALLGAGIEEPGVALINTGTGGQVMTPISAPVAGRFGPGVHQYRSASDTTPWYAMAAVANVGLALGWVRDVLGYDWDQMYATADSALTGHEADPTFLPFLTGEREPSQGTLNGGAWSGLTLAHDRAALARSAMRGVAFYLGLRAKALMDLTDVSVAVMSGGAVRHIQWVETLATILGLGITVTADAHLTVRGAARLAARGIGFDLPDPPAERTIEPRSDIDIDIDEALRTFQAATSRHISSSD